MARAFDAADYISVGTVEDLRLQNHGHFTIAFWIDIPNPSAAEALTLCGNSVSGSTRGWGVWFENRNLAVLGDTSRALRILMSSGSVTLNSTSGNDAITSSGWHHVAITCTPGAEGTRFYVDGVDIGHGSFGGQNTVTSLASGNSVHNPWIGGVSPDSDVLPFAGTMAEFAVWEGRALSAADVAGLVRGQSPVKYIRGLSFYDPLLRTPRSWLGPAVNDVTGTTVVPHPGIVYGGDAFFVSSLSGSDPDPQPTPSVPGPPVLGVTVSGTDAATDVFGVTLSGTDPTFELSGVTVSFGPPEGPPDPFPRLAMMPRIPARGARPHLQ